MDQFEFVILIVIGGGFGRIVEQQRARGRWRMEQFGFVIVVVETVSGTDDGDTVGTASGTDDDTIGTAFGTDDDDTAQRRVCCTVMDESWRSLFLIRRRAVRCPMWH